MRTRFALPFAFMLVLSSQVAPRVGPPGVDRRPEEPERPDQVRLPNGKLQQDEILKNDFEKSLDDARELAKMADELKTDLEKSDRNVLSLQALKKTEEIEKLAKRIRGRMKRS